METLLQDVRYGARRLLRNPGFTLVTVLTLALGIGANSAIFSVVHAVLLAPLPYPEPDRLVRIFTTNREGERFVVSSSNFFDARRESRAFEEMSFLRRTQLTLTGTGDPLLLRGVRTGTGFFQTLGVAPQLGRAFLPEDNGAGRNGVVILSDGVWQQRFGGDPAVVGRVVSINSEPHEVVGVMPPGFSYPAEQDAWVPFEYTAAFTGEGSRGGYSLDAFGRLRPGASVEQAALELETIGRRLEQQYPETNTGFNMTAVSMHDAAVGEIRTALLVLLGAVGLVLLIACANVANLLMARASARESELAVRTALGAGRARLVRQLLTESVLLGLGGGMVGLLLAIWGTGLLVSMRPQGIPRLEEVGVNGTVVVFTTLLSFATGLIFGLAPAFQATRSSLVTALKEGGRGALAGRSGMRMRNTLVVTETALAVMLLVGAGLLVKSFVRLQSVDPGFRSDGVLAVRLSLPPADYGTDALRGIFYEQAIERIRSIPGVTSAAAVSALPLDGQFMILGYEVDGREPARPGEGPVAQILTVTPDYFATLGIPLVRGRAITEQDRPGAPGAVVLNEEAVRQHFPGEDPMGKDLTISWERDSSLVRGTVVGIVRNTRQASLDQEVGPVIYVAHAQVALGGMNVVARTTVPPLSLGGSVRREVEALDPNLPVDNLRLLEDVVASSVSQPRFYMLLLSIFAGVALLLAAIGIFGVISFGVTQRRREIGIRMALGADPRSVLRLVVGGALALSVLGVGIGLAGALAGSRLLSGLLFGVETTDPPIFGTVAVVLVGVALAASFLPARAATRVDPNVALRYE